MIEDGTEPIRRISRRTRGERTKRRQRYLLSSMQKTSMENTDLDYNISASSTECSPHRSVQNNNNVKSQPPVKEFKTSFVSKMKSGEEVTEENKEKHTTKSPKSTKLKRSYSLIKKLKLKSKLNPITAPQTEGDTANSAQPSTSSEPASIERQTPEGDDNFILTKSASDTNLQETWKTVENLMKDNKNTSIKSAAAIESNQFYLGKEQTSLPERTKSLENLKDMPAYGELILDQVPSTSNVNQSTYKPKDHLYKILVIGDLGTGKTSIIKRYVHRFFTQHYRATIGVDFALKVLNWDENTLIRLQLWDIAGQERYGNMTRVYYKEAVGAFIVFDVTRKNTFDSVINWKTDLDSKVQLPDGSPIPCVLLANKCDQLRESLTSNKALDDYCRENGFTAWFETSAKDNINIDEAAKSLVETILEQDALIYESKRMDDKFSVRDSSDQRNGRKDNAFTFRWENISVSIKSRQFTFCQLTETCKILLNNVSGFGKSSSLIAIFGPSGCGKTTLLGSISGRIKVKNGILKLNNNIATERYIRSISGYIPQEDYLMESLTVYEQMQFMTALKLHKSKGERNTKIKTLLTELGLDASRHTILRSLSGGEKRKLSLATELINDPYILFCDEPTTGLDSFSALAVIQKLEAVAMTGKLVLVTVHQPSSQLFDLFNNIILLANGQLIFEGSKQQAKLFFEKAKLYCPVSYNPADFYLKCLTTNYNDEETGEKQINRLSELYREEYLEEKNNSKSAFLRLQPKESFSDKKNFAQLGWLIWRAFIDSKRNFSRFRAGYILLMMTSIIITLSYANVRLTDSNSVQNIQGALYLIISELIYIHMYSVIHIFPEEVPVFVWEKSVYSSFPYLLSKALSLVPVCLVNSISFLMVYFIVLQFMTSVELFLGIFVILFITSICGMCLGLCLSAIFSTVEYIELFIVPFDIVVMILSGYWIKIDSVPKFFTFVKYLSPFYFGFESVSTSFWKKVTHLANCTGEESPCYESGDAVLKDYGFFKEYDIVTYDMIYMFVLILVYLYLGYLGLLRKRALYEMY
ncbi:hypothetical protein NQ317_013174 [Molorchus minor]|uniref:ABC transporter domain-containing protein n=1 Tax=Molorchus minor TaxID=1323400 RepID=A0ABQ9J9J1_9CUCU|nr:hypothetical protein NQ317_013174 [Molorchus minor]